MRRFDVLNRGQPVYINIPVSTEWPRKNWANLKPESNLNALLKNFPSYRRGRKRHLGIDLLIDRVLTLKYVSSRPSIARKAIES